MIPPISGSPFPYPQEEDLDMRIYVQVDESYNLARLIRDLKSYLREVEIVVNDFGKPPLVVEFQEELQHWISEREGGWVLTDFEEAEEIKESISFKNVEEKDFRAADMLEAWKKEIDRIRKEPGATGNSELPILEIIR